MKHQVMDFWRHADVLNPNQSVYMGGWSTLPELLSAKMIGPNIATQEAH